MPESIVVVLTWVVSAAFCISASYALWGWLCLRGTQRMIDRIDENAGV